MRQGPRHREPGTKGTKGRGGREISPLPAWVASDAYGQGGHLTEPAGFVDYGVEVLEHIGDGHGVDFAARVEAFFNELLQIAARDLRGELVGDDLAGAFFLLDPCLAGQGDPHWPAVHVETNIHRVGVAGGDGNDVRLPAAVQVFAAPAVGYVEVFVHDFSLSFLPRLGKLPAWRCRASLIWRFFMRRP